MPFNINEMRARLNGGGARPNLFEVILPFPTIVNSGSAASSKLTFTCKAAQLPGSDITPINVPYFGRMIKMPGSRVFQEWTTTIINDEDFLVFDALTSWMNAINSHAGNINEAGNSSLDYQSTADVIHYGKDGSAIKTIKVVNMWPSSIAPIDLGWENNDQLEEFTCIWQYDYWVSPGVTS